MFGLLPIPRYKLAVVLLVFVALLSSVLSYGSMREARGYAQATAEFNGRVAAYERKALEQEVADQKERLTLKQAQEVELGLLRDKLTAASTLRARTQTIVQEVVKYVTEKSDSACVVPVGAVWMLDTAVASESPQAAASVAGSRPADVDAPSGIALSRLTADTTWNLGECVERGQVIQAWQSWYSKNQIMWEGYRKSFSSEVLPDLKAK